MNFFRKDERTQRNNWNKSAKSKKREMPILWDLWRIPVVQEVSKGFPFRLVNMPSFPCFAIALARPDYTIRNCLLPILPADQVIRLDFIINLVRNGCLEILRRRAFFNHRSIKIYQNDILCDGMLVLVFFFFMLLFFFHKDIFCLSDAGFRLQVFFLETHELQTSSLARPKLCCVAIKKVQRCNGRVGATGSIGMSQIEPRRYWMG